MLQRLEMQFQAKPAKVFAKNRKDILSSLPSFALRCFVFS